MDYYKNRKNNKLWHVVQSVALLVVLICGYAFWCDSINIFTRTPRCKAFEMEAHYEKHSRDFDLLRKEAAGWTNSGSNLIFENSWGSMTQLKVEKGEERHSYADPFMQDIDSALVLLDKTRDNLSRLNKMVMEVGCDAFQIRADKNYFTVRFKTLGLDTYSYRIYYSSIPEEEFYKIKEDCTLIPYNQYVVFEYGPGATGYTCFPLTKEYVEDHL